MKGFAEQRVMRLKIFIDGNYLRRSERIKSVHEFDETSKLANKGEQLCRQDVEVL